jgi:hypothetical protein
MMIVGGNNKGRVMFMWTSSSSEMDRKEVKEGR